MKSGLLTYRKDRLSKWLFTLTVLCSIFALLPSINHSKFQQEKTQTELVCSSAVNTLSKTVPYHNITESVDNNKKINPFLINQTASLVHYNKNIIVKLLCISAHFFEYKNTSNFIQLKTIPKSSDEENFISIKG